MKYGESADYNSQSPRELSATATKMIFDDHSFFNRIQNNETATYARQQSCNNA